MATRLILIFAGLLSAGDEVQALDEYQVKAAFVYNFAKFVEWPAQSFKTPKDPISICVLGQNLIGDALELAVRGKSVEGRPFTVRTVPDAQRAGNCQILFVSSSERKRLRSILGEIKSGGVLTVGETDSFIAEGGVVNFKLEGGKVRIQINVDAAEQGQLQISSKLLSLAQIVKK